MSQLLQDISLSIDETGTQATAVTEVYRLKMIMFEFRLTFDHPFTFAIQNDATGALLLSGVILDPTAQ
jgi:serine protease inhibitor